MTLSLSPARAAHSPRASQPSLESSERHRPPDEETRLLGQSATGEPSFISSATQQSKHKPHLRSPTCFNVSAEAEIPKCTIRAL